MTHSWRTIVAFVLAPVLPCGLTTLALSALSSQWNGFVFGFLAMLVVCEGLIVAVAIPAYFAFKRFYKVQLAQCLIAGALVGLVPSLVGAFFSPSEGYSAGDSGGPTIINGTTTAHGRVVEAQAAVFQGALGTLIGGCFWTLAFYRRPAQVVAHEPVTEA
jgi:hypothetical protein